MFVIKVGFNILQCGHIPWLHENFPVCIQTSENIGLKSKQFA